LRFSQFRASHAPAHQRRPLAGVLTLWLLLAFTLAACSGLGGEPPIVATQIPPTEAPAELGYPVEPPDLALGASLFAENCTACHGPQGEGNGPLVTSEQISAPPDFTDPATASGMTPAEWFDVITQGRIEKMMPPWQNALSESERWAVALYTYTLAYGATDLTEGEALYADACAECHGPTGQGDGERAGEISRPIANLTDPIEMTALSDSALYTIITEGQGEQMPAFADEMSEAQRQSVVRYLRSLSLANTEVIGSAPTAEATADAEATEIPEFVVVSGQLVNGTAGGELPEALVVTLYRLEETTDGIQDESFETTATADGGFTFEDVPFDPASSYILSTIYRERLFTGDVVAGADLPDSGPLTLTLYEPTEDPGVITITSVTTSIDAVGDGLQVLQEFVFENSSDRVYTNSLEVGDRAYASVVVGLPPGAAGLAFAGAQNRFVVSDEQGVVVDTVPVWPGRPHGVQLSYFIPYEDGAIIEQPVYYRLDGLVRLLIWPQTMGFSSEQLAPVGEQSLQGQPYAAYEGTLTLNSGDIMAYELSGSTHNTAAPQVTPVSNNTTLLLVGGLLLEIVLIVAVLYWYFRRRSRVQAAPPDDTTLIDRLIRQIAELDDAHDNGEVDDASYERQRAQLKARLAELMNKDKRA
jgi:mono/diheme cytochrome c family protein